MKRYKRNDFFWMGRRSTGRVTARATARAACLQLVGLLQRATCIGRLGGGAIHNIVTMGREGVSVLRIFLIFMY